MPHGYVAGVAGDFPGDDPLTVLSGHSKVARCDIAVDLLVGHNAGDSWCGTALLVANGDFEMVGLTVGGLGTAVSVGAVFVSDGSFECIGTVGLSNTNAHDNAVGVQQGTGDVPGHGDSAATGGLSTESTDRGVGDGSLGEFAAHEDHLTSGDNRAV